jgi:hypothetical protein
LAAANGQFLVVDAAAYRRAGGHAAVRGDVLDDVALARAVKVAGGNGGFVDGTAIASCRMYTGSQAVVDGYAKSLWRAFGGPPGAILVALTFLVLYVVPWGLVAVAPLAWPAAVAGPAGRVISAVRTGSRPPAVALLHPLSALVFAVLVVVSVSRHRRRRLTWKGRTLP